MIDKDRNEGEGAGLPGRKLGLEIAPKTSGNNPPPEAGTEYSDPAEKAAPVKEVKAEKKKEAAPKVNPPDPWERMAERMAQKMAEQQKKVRRVSEPSTFSGATVAAALSFAALVVVSIYFYQYQQDVTARLEVMKSQLGSFAPGEAPKIKKQKERDTTNVKMVRAELGRSIVALEKAGALGDPKIAEEAEKLRDEIAEVMAELENVPARPRYELSAPESAEYVPGDTP
ncbi:MAG: hypothetical protein OEZ04_02210 [Nitrospinota bacterium]|nr:hypothetical protein [Nitrospinota bacterium]